MLINLKDLVKKYDMNITGVIHIGGHHGEEDSIYNDLKISNKIYFEPIIKNFEVLKLNVTNNSILYNFALGNENKQIEMFVESSNNGQSCSILKPCLHLTQYPNIVFNEKENITMVKLDDVDINQQNYNFINIDVQGYELEVFKGAVNCLNNIDYIYTEINRDEVYENCAKVTELSNFLNSYGFILVEESWDGITWGDGLFIKRK